MADGGFVTNPDDLRGASSGIRDAVDAMGESTLGRLPGASGTFGHDGLAGAFSSFCSAAHEAIESMRRDAHYHGSALTEAADGYVGTDVHGQNRLQGGGR
jgi:hypothetical protein